MATKFTGKGFEAYGEDIWDSLTTSMKTAVAAGEGTAKKTAPVDTGQLRGSISHNVERKGKSITGTIYTNTEYAAHQEFGTRNGVKGQHFMRKGIANAARKFIADASKVEGDVK